MKQFLKNICMIMLTFSFLFLLFKNPDISKNSIKISFNIWLNNLVPSLFPMIIINDILINYNFPNIISKIFYKLFNKIFKLSFNGTYFLLMSMFIGTPTNAILMHDLLNKNMIDEVEANKLIHICYFSNPLFLYNMLSFMFDNKITLKIIIIHYLSNFITLFIIRNKYIPKIDKKYKNESSLLGKVITKSCSKAINAMITILGIISFYILIANYLNNNILLAGMLEITTGLSFLIKINITYKKLLCIIIINFGGLSIFSQIKSILEDTNINFINYFKGRVSQVIISIILLYII